MAPLHGIATRHDLPLPFGFVLVGAALALAISFAVLLLAWRTPRFADPGGRPVPAVQRAVEHRGVRMVAASLVVLLYAWVALAVFAGPDRLTNPAFGFVYVWMWVGLVPVSLLLGRFWRATNPVRTVHRILTALARTDPRAGLAVLPARVGVWPAAVGLFGFAWLELVQPDRTTLAVLRLWALAWFVTMVVGAVVFGSRWVGAADPFEVYASTVAALSPWHRHGSELRLVNPLAGLSRWDPPAGSAAVVAVLLGSTAFDSFANTSWWIQTVQASAVGSVWWDTGGLLALIAVVGLSFSAAAAAMARYDGGRRPAAAYPRMLAASVVPIVVGYAVAHYATLLVVEGQRTAITLSDPLGRGWNVFGTAELGVSSAIYDHPTGVALTQLVAILAGHLLGIVVAHEKAVSLLPPRRALPAQLPMLAVMVFYTCSGLVLLFSP